MQSTKMVKRHLMKVNPILAMMFAVVCSGERRSAKEQRTILPEYASLKTKYGNRSNVGELSISAMSLKCLY